MSAGNVGNPLAAMLISPNTEEFTLEKSFSHTDPIPHSLSITESVLE